MRKTKKFSEGGAQGRYDRRMADIEKDYAKASKGKTGRAAEVAAAKRDQRIADAKDDLAKRTGADRTQTRAAEAAAERNLTMTRKFGAMKPAVKADDVAKVGPSEDLLKSAPKPQMPSKPEAKSRPAPTRRAPAKDTRQSAPAVKQEIRTPATDPRAAMRQATAAREREERIQANRAAQRRRTAGIGQLVGPASEQERRIRDAQKTAMAIKPMDQRSDVTKRREYAERRIPGESVTERVLRINREMAGRAAGGAVKKDTTMMDKKKKPMPPQPTPAERAASKRQDESLKKAKPTPADAGAIARGNRSSGMNKGGAVKKYAGGGLAKIMPTANQMGSLGMAKGGKAKMADKAGRALKKKSADTMGRAMMKKAGGGKCYAKGGSVSARADGCAVKGKTKGKMI